MKKDSKIYIAGHRGLVGSAIMRCLNAGGYHNIIGCTHAELELTRQTEVEAFFERERPEYVFLAAARVGGIHANNTYPAEFIYSNLCIQVNIIDAAYKYGTKKLLFLGSSCIYPKFAPQPMKEEYLLSGLLEPTNEPYAIAKIAGIKMCQSYNRQYGTNFISVMPTNLYGPNDNFDLNSSHVLPAMIRKFHDAKRTRDDRSLRSLGRPLTSLAGTRDEKEETKDEGRPFAALTRTRDEKDMDSVTLWGTGSPYREFLHVDDLADACVFLMNNYDGSEIVNIGTGEDLTIKELAEMIKEIVGYEGSIIWDTTKPDGTPKKLLDVSKLKSLGWLPKISLKEGIKTTYEWYVTNVKGAEGNEPCKTGILFRQ